MGRNTTKTACHRQRHWAWLFAGLGACTGGADPDPRIIARQIGAHRLPVEQPAALMVASVSLAPRDAGYHAALPAPAPLTESALLPGNAPTVRIAVGRDAGHVIDAGVLERFAAGGQLALASSLATDRDAVASLLLGRCDFAILGSALAAADVEAGLRQTRLGVELFGLAVAQKSTLRSLTRAQMRGVLAGQVATWSEIGCEGGHIVAFVPGDRALRDRAAMAMIPGDPFGRDCVPAHDGELVRQLQRPDAIAVVRITGQTLPQGMRLLQIDWNPPSVEAFANGFYPFGLPIVMATAGEPTAMAANFAAWARTGAGKELLALAIQATH